MVANPVPRCRPASHSRVYANWSRSFAQLLRESDKLLNHLRRLEKIAGGDTGATNAGLGVGEWLLRAFQKTTATRPGSFWIAP